MTGEMPAGKLLVLDANILLRAILGVRVRHLLQTYEDSVDFYAPDVCFIDARTCVDDLAVRRHFDPQQALLLLDQLSRLVESVEHSLYSEHEAAARLRIEGAIRTIGRLWRRR